MTPQTYMYLLIIDAGKYLFQLGSLIAHIGNLERNMSMKENFCPNYLLVKTINFQITISTGKCSG